MKTYMIKVLTLLLFTAVTVSSCSVQYRQNRMHRREIDHNRVHDRDHDHDRDRDHHYDQSPRRF